MWSLFGIGILLYSVVGGVLKVLGVDMLQDLPYVVFLVPWMYLVVCIVKTWIDRRQRR